MLVTLQRVSLYCAGAAWWLLGMRVSCCVCEVSFGVGVAFEWYSSFLWCVGGLSLAGRCLGGGGGMACCELSQYGSIRIKRQYQTSCTHVATAISSAFPVLTGGA